MTYSRKFALAVLLAAIAAGASAQGKTREQVRAELAQAQRSGELLLASGLREKDLCPGCYPAGPAPVGKTRAQVEADLAIAIRDGDMLAPGESGLTEDQLMPQVYARQRATDEASMLRGDGGTS